MTLTSSIECVVMAVLYPVAGKVLSTKKSLGSCSFSAFPDVTWHVPDGIV